ncbi:MAG TPA: type II toxin-antitoxin system VapC family toxin [Solirubrobacterales bacterium]|nr:type II toxin-antitoxin system VapC family toxin [Solirubrobacterales bacterium]
MSTSTGPRSGTLILLDTHVVGWLYEGADNRIPGAVRELLDSGQPCVSPVVELELTYLHEVGRVTEPASAPLGSLRRSIGLQLADVSLEALTQAAIDLSWTRDPFDRMIAAHAIVANAPLVTADRAILDHLPLATWA